MLRYEANIRAELEAREEEHGWFTTTANSHVKHEVAAQDKSLIEAALAGGWAPAAREWDDMGCDILHTEGKRCAPNVEPGK